jgi:hypothetical protein
MKSLKPRSMMQEHHSLIKRASAWSREQLDSASTYIFELLWKLLRRTFMKAFKKKRTCIVLYIGRHLLVLMLLDRN